MAELRTWDVTEVGRGKPRFGTEEARNATVAACLYLIHCYGSRKVGYQPAYNDMDQFVTSKGTLVSVTLQEA